MSPEEGPDLQLVTTPESPGLYVYAPVQFDLADENGQGADDRWKHFFGPLIAQPRASYACRCGFVRRGAGTEAVKEIVALATDHPLICLLDKPVRSAA